MSGVVSRQRDEGASNRADEISLESLVQKASSRPPKPNAFDEPVVVPLLPRIELTPLEAAMVGSVRPGASRPPLPSYAKWMIAVPWALLALVVVGIAIAWPRAPRSVQPEYALAPIPQAAASESAPIGFEPNDVVIEEPSMTFVLSEDEVEAPIDRATEATPAPVAEAEIAPVVEAAIDPALAASEPVVVAEPAVAPSEPAPESVVAPEVAATAADIRSHLTGTTSTATAAAPTAAEAVLPDRPSRSDVSRALRAVAPAVDACTANVGTATIHLVVNHDGSVASANATGEYAGTSEGACMANAVRGAHFAPFVQPTLAVTFPFALR